MSKTPRYGSADGERMRRSGETMRKKPNVVYVLPLEHDADIEVGSTGSTCYRALAGDHLMHDPISGDVWTVTSEYLRTHYDRAEAFAS